MPPPGKVFVTLTSFVLLFGREPGSSGGGSPLFGEMQIQLRAIMMLKGEASHLYYEVRRAPNVGALRAEMRGRRPKVKPPPEERRVSIVNVALSVGSAGEA